MSARASAADCNSARGLLLDDDSCEESCRGSSFGTIEEEGRFGGGLDEGWDVLVDSLPQFSVPRMVNSGAFASRDSYLLRS